MRFFKYCFFLALLSASCKKEKETSINFTEISSGTNYNLRCIVQNLDNPNAILVGGGDDTHGVLLLSTDKGLSFKLFSDSLPSRVNALLFSDYKSFALCNNFLLMKSYYRAEHWDSIELANVPYQYRTNLFDIKFINDTIGFFCGGEEYAHGIIGKTINGGQTWKYTFVDHEMRSIDFKDNLHGYCGGYGAMYYTDDGGENWQLTESNNEFITSINFNSANGIACGYEGGILRNQNTLNWEKISGSNSVFSSRSHFNSVCSNDNYNYFIFGNDGKCAVSNDGGNNWQTAIAFDKNTIYDAIMLSANEGIAVGENGKIFHFSKK